MAASQFPGMSESKAYPVQNPWRLRRDTLRQAQRILHAEYLIRFRSMAKWQSSLGAVILTDFGAASFDELRHAEMLQLARRAAERTERAAHRLMYSPKCLPVAMALQWRLKDSDIPSKLVIAMHRGEGASTQQDETLNVAVQDSFHAWVELGKQMLIGACERSEYRPVLAFQLPEIAG